MSHARLVSLTRAEAESRLKAGGKPDDCLVRFSEKEQRVVVSYKQGDKMTHHLLDGFFSATPEEAARALKEKGNGTWMAAFDPTAKNPKPVIYHQDKYGKMQTITFESVAQFSLFSQQAAAQASNPKQKIVLDVSEDFSVLLDAKQRIAVGSLPQSTQTMLSRLSPADSMLSAGTRSGASSPTSFTSDDSVTRTRSPTPSLLSQAPRVNAPNVRLVGLLDFDGTITKKEGSEAVNAPLFRSLYANGESPKTSYADARLKSHSEMVSALRAGFAKDPSFAPTPDAIAFLTKMIESQGEIHLISKNRGEYIKAALEAAGMARDKIEQLKIHDVSEVRAKGGKGEIAEAVMKPYDAKATVAIVCDDSPKDFALMVQSTLPHVTRDKETQSIVAKQQPTGKFNWEAIYNDVEARASRQNQHMSTPPSEPPPAPTRPRL